MHYTPEQPRTNQLQRTEQLYGEMEVGVTVEGCQELGLSNIELPDAVLDLPFIGDLQKHDRALYQHIFSIEGMDKEAGLRLRRLRLAGVFMKEMVNYEPPEYGPETELFPGCVDLLRDYFGLPEKPFLDDNRTTSEPVLTYRDIAQAIDNYYEWLGKDASKEEHIAAVQNAREQFLLDIEGPIAHELVSSEHTRKQIAEITSMTPIVILDPLQMALFTKVEDSIGLFGYFDLSETRKVYLQFHPSQRSSSAEATDTTRHVVYHELLHAAFGRTHRPYKHTKHLVADSKFPEFLEEAVIENISVILSSQHNTPTTWVDQIVENRWRRAVGAPSRSLIPNTTTEKQRYAMLFDSTTVAYHIERLLTDIYLDSIPWGKAGITKKQAEQLLIDAVFEAPNSGATTPAEKSPARKAFFEVVRQAGGAGLLNRIEASLRFLGDEHTLSRLQHPGIDPLHVPDFPLTGSSRAEDDQQSDVSDTEKKLEYLLSSQSRDLGAIAVAREQLHREKDLASRYTHRHQQTKRINRQQATVLGRRDYSQILRHERRPSDYTPRPFIAKERK